MSGGASCYPMGTGRLARATNEGGDEIGRTLPQKRGLVIEPSYRGLARC